MDDIFHRRQAKLAFEQAEKCGFAHAGQLAEFFHGNLLGEVALDVLHHVGKAVGRKVLGVIIKNELTRLGLHQPDQQFLEREGSQHIFGSVGFLRQMNEPFQGAC